LIVKALNWTSTRRPPRAQMAAKARASAGVTWPDGIGRLAVRTERAS
jgi:hypothetical protein